MLPPPEQLKSSIEHAVPGVAVGLDGGALLIEAKDLLQVCRYLQHHDPLSLDYVANLTAVDYAQERRMDVVYHLYSMAQRHGPVTLRVRLDRDHPVVPSVTPLWRGAEFQEREAYDLFGVRFEGHPDLRRILMWEGFKGHPMRKDYVVEDQDAPAGASPVPAAPGPGAPA